MRLLVGAWRETGPGVRVLCLALWAAGAVTLVAGVWGDATGWWQDRGYLANLVSSATSGLFGVPVALVVIQHITTRRADEREAREVQRLAARLAREMTTDARGLVRVEAQSRAVAVLRAALRAARQALTTAPSPDPGPVQRAYELWGELVSPAASAQSPLDRLSANWRSLKDDARPRLIHAGQPWLDPDLVELLDETLTRALSPRADLTWMDDVRHAGESPLRLRGPADVDAHLRLLHRADEYLRAVERASRYAEDIRRRFDRPGGPAA